MNSDLTPASSAGITDNPQAIYSNANGVNSSYFQQSAGMDSLKQNYQLSVVQTGEPIRTVPPKNNMSGMVWGLIVLGLVLVAVTASLLRKRLIKHPKLSKITTVENEKPQAKPISGKVSKAKGKKKQSRSKRHR